MLDATIQKGETLRKMGASAIDVAFIRTVNVVELTVIANIGSGYDKEIIL